MSGIFLPWEFIHTENQAVVTIWSHLVGSGACGFRMLATPCVTKLESIETEMIWGAFRQQLPELLRLAEVERARQLDDPIEIDMGLSPSQVAAALDYQQPTLR